MYVVLVTVVESQEKSDGNGDRGEGDEALVEVVVVVAR